MRNLVVIFIIAILLVGGVLVFLFQDSILPQDNVNAPENEGDPVELQVISDNRLIYNPYTEVTIISPQDLELASGAEAEFEKIGELEEENYYILRINEVIDGEVTRKATLENSTGGTQEVSINITRNENVLPPGYLSIDGWEGASYILDGDNILSVVDRDNRLREDYAPDDIINLNEEFGIYTLNDASLQRDAAIAMNRLWQDAGEATGEYFTVVSGYRSFDEQFRLYSSYISQFGEEETNTFSAKPGHSEHQLGVTVDISTSELDLQLTEEFAQTDLGRWVIENSYDYGYVPSYPRETQTDTGFYEPWQFRYIGKENAQKFKDSEQSLTAWLNSQ